MKYLKHPLFFICLLGLLLGTGACKKSSSDPPIDDEVDLDGKKINDSSLTFPHLYMLSAANPHPAPSDLIKPVIITVHGFSASNFEWREFKQFATSIGDVNVSMVLLGGHGRDYSDFKSASWQDWQTPIITEYNKLQQQGYQKITIVASSTGCPLVLQMIAENKISTGPLKHLVFIDPIIIPSNKLLSAVPVLGPIVGYSETSMDPGENGNWYKYRPHQALRELDRLTKMERKKLEKGIKLPEGMDLRVYKSERDGSADPASAVLLKNGVKLSDGSNIETIMVDTDLHVFTRLNGRANITAEQRALQKKTFEEIHAISLK